MPATAAKGPPPPRSEKTAAKLDKSKQVVVKRAFSQDHQLDIFGIGMVFLGLVIFFGVLSPNDGTITSGIVALISQLFGDIKYVCWVPCTVVGGWLILRHFRDEPPILQYHRMVGWLFVFLALVATTQLVELLARHVPRLSDLATLSSQLSLASHGGGWLGDKLYMLMESTLGDYGTIVIVVAVWIISLMLALNLTLMHITGFLQSIAHWFGRAGRGYAESQAQARAAAALRAQAKQAPMAVAAPAAAMPLPLAAPATAAALSAGGTASAPPAKSARGLFSRGSAAPPPPPPNTAPVEAGAAPVATPTSAANPGGLFGSRAAPPPPGSALVAKGDKSDKPDTSAAMDQPADKPAAVPASTAPPKPFGSGLFGSRSAPPPPKPANVPVSQADTPDNGADNGKSPDKPVADKVADKPAAASAPATPGKPFGGGVFGSRNAPPPPKPADATSIASDSLSVSDNGTRKPSDAPTSTPSVNQPAAAVAAPAKPSGSSLFGSRSASPPPSKPADMAADDESADADGNSDGVKTADVAADKQVSTPAAASKPVAGGLFGSRPVPSKPDALQTDQPATANRNPPNQPASAPMPKPTAGGSFSSQPLPVKPGNAQSAPAADKSGGSASKAPVSGGLFGSRPVPPQPASPTFGGTLNKTGNGAPANESDGEDSVTVGGNKPAAPAPKAPPSGIFGSVGARSASGPAASPIPTRPAPASPLARPVPKTTILEPDDTDIEDEEEEDADPKYVDLDEVESPEDTPKLPVRTVQTGPFGGPARSTSTFASPVNKPSAATTSPSTTPVVAPPKPSGASPFSAPRPAQPAATSAPVSSPAPSQPAAVAASVAAESSAPVRNGPIIRQPSAEAPPTDSAIPRDKTESGWELPDYRETLEQGTQRAVDRDYLLGRSRVIEETLQSFGAPGKIVEINSGPVITQFGVEPDYLVSRQGKKTRVKVSSIAKLDADLALALAARSIRIEAPVPGKGFVGIEVPNAKTAVVCLRDIIESESFRHLKSKLRIGLGQSVDGAPISADLTMMPHLLIAGTTGSGKSVCVNAIIACLLLENTPDDLKFIMVDPKRVELTGYNGIPHLVAPVVVDLERIVSVLKWVTREMDERYKRFSQVGARHIVDYNTRIASNGTRLPYLVVVIDELADLMMLAPDETEKVLTRLAQMARATGIHLIVSTQRPSTDVVTGLIKANFPARISFAVASNVDSRVILDTPGAEKLLGRGDMLYQAPDAAAPVRMQGVYVSDAEINRIASYWKAAKVPAGASAQPISGRDVFTAPEPVQSRADKYKSTSPASPSTVSAPSTPNRTATGIGSAGSGGNTGSSAIASPKPAGVTTAAPSGTPSNGPKPPFANAPPATSGVRPTLTPGDDEDEMYDEAVDLVKRMDNKVSVSLLQRRLRIGYNRAERLIDLMKQRGVIDSNAVTDVKTGDEE
ncbi:MAG: FtsK/SpoIIIE family DNA translocase [Aggregatilineales bacterium]